MAKQRCARSARRSGNSVFQFVFTFSPKEDLLHLHGEVRPLVAARTIPRSSRRRAQSSEPKVGSLIAERSQASEPNTIAPEMQPELRKRDWLTVKDCAVLLMGDLEHLDLAKAKARVSRAASANKFVTNSKSGAERRIERHSFSTWRLQQRDKALQESDNLFAAGND